MDVPKAIHLHNIAHYNPLHPLLAQHSIHLDQVAYENGLTYPGADTHCDHCGVFLISGLTCSHRIAYKRAKSSKSPKQQKRSRVFLLKCLVCQYTKTSDALLNERVNKPVPQVQEPNPTRKMKKGSELSALLAAKKAQTQQRNAKSLSLMEFMQS